MAAGHGLQALSDAVARQIALALFQLNITYTVSSSIAERWPASLSMSTMQQDWAAGSRVPNVLLGGSSLGQGPRLLHVLKEGQGKQILLIFTGSEEDQTILDHLCDVGRSVQQRYGESIAVHMVVPHPAVQKRLSWAGSVLLDGRTPLSSLQGHCHIERNGLNLLRPDGIVAYRCQPVQPEHFFAYLQRYFLASDNHQERS
ncbi:hypothetical protein KDA_31080 [Dictyobacter alpinus]|uniref:Alkyl hydroperoxide reductase subunit C/ Thiol specific antioxidant domain-containing protein n=1 Tax=Dictyobacter alpinus TaxID=2014873 RepID=A0A402B8C5_9CHLR|nr:hypothetical protein [Dictyobacter alpinus]GCE27624.1 hypothetical protein KDA_31080 [Dictyobacter alpinus]